MGRIVEDGLQSGVLSELTNTSVLRRNHDVTTSKEVVLTSGRNNVEHVREQRAPPVWREQLAAPEPPALAGGQDQRMRQGVRTQVNSPARARSRVPGGRSLRPNGVDTPPVPGCRRSRRC